MHYSFWNEYNFIPYNLTIKFDIRLQNVIHKIETFFKQVAIKSLEDENIEFYLAGSCIKKDAFHDIDVFFLTKNELEDITSNINKKYFLYTNNSLSYEFENDIFQLEYRERFLEKSLLDIVDIFDFYSTKIAFKCVLNTKTFEIKVIESDIRKEFIDYITDNTNRLTKVNINPFVSLQRAIDFLKRGDDVPFSVFLEIFLKIKQLDKNLPIEKYFDRLQGDEEALKEIKSSIKLFFRNENHV